MKKLFCDLLIVGSGPAGLKACQRALSYGKSVVIVERESIGGTCINRGCIPFKTLIHHGKLIRKVMDREVMGLEYRSRPKIDFSKISELVAIRTETLQRGAKFLVKKAVFLQGELSFLTQNTALINGVTESEITFENVLIATGLAFNPDFDNCFWMRRTLPDEAVIVGGNVSGIESASILAMFGVSSTILEKGSRILPNMPSVAREVVLQSLQTLGVSVELERNVYEMFAGDIEDEQVSEYMIRYMEGDWPIDFYTKLLLDYSGGKPCYPAGIENFDYKNDDGGFVIVDERMNAGGNLFAVGDIVSNVVHTAYTADKMAEIAVDSIYSQEKTCSLSNYIIPSSIYAPVEVAWFGSVTTDVQKHYYKSNALAVCDGESRGFIEIYHSDGNIVGAVVVGERATELIHGVMLKTGRPFLSLHPTYSELLDSI